MFGIALAKGYPLATMDVTANDGLPNSKKKDETMTLSAVLENGKILVRETTTMHDEPTNMVHFWPTRFTHWDLDNHTEPLKVEDIKVERSGYCGYSLKFPGCGFWSDDTRYIAMKAVRVETEPLPCPKVRKGIETRYHYGQWQKYLKSSKRGWVTA